MALEIKNDRPVRALMSNTLPVDMPISVFAYRLNGKNLIDIVSNLPEGYRRQGLITLGTTITRESVEKALPVGLKYILTLEYANGLKIDLTSDNYQTVIPEKGLTTALLMTVYYGTYA